MAQLCKVLSILGGDHKAQLLTECTNVSTSDLCEKAYFIWTYLWDDTTRKLSECTKSCIKINRIQVHLGKIV